MNYCTRGEDSITGANRCRDILLVLQENVTFTVDRPNPTYAPFDPSLQTLTDELIARMQDYARKGTSALNIITFTGYSLSRRRPN